MASVATSAFAAALVSSLATPRCSRASRRSPRPVATRAVIITAADDVDTSDDELLKNNECVDDAGVGVARHDARLSRRGALRAVAATAGATAAATITTAVTAATSFAADDATTAIAVNPRAYFQRYPTLFAPFYGADERATLLTEVCPGSVWALQQNLEIGPLETPLRCVVVKLASGALWAGEGALHSSLTSAQA